MDKSAHDQIERFSEIIKESNYIVFLGGAGVSTESGIPDTLCSLLLRRDERENSRL